ncbi:MAG: alpha/beta hydrolase family protein, partial [Acidimicrobiia bacterium]
PGPAILAVHGHGPGKDEVCGIDTPVVNAALAEHHDDYAHSLAQRGYVVLAPDLRCFGERADWQPEDHYHCDVNLVHAVMAGCSPLAQNLWDLQRALDVLAGHALVDPGRLGAVGFSYGATMTLFLAALDARVQAAVISGYLSSWRAAHRVPWNMCGSQVLTGMLGSLEHVDVAALVAPRPLLVETGTDDALFPEAVARTTVAQLRTVYGCLGASDDALAHDVFEGGHQWHGAQAGEFLDRWLKAEPGSGGPRSG